MSKLEDNRKYQELSYVIKSEYTITKYIDLLRNIVHPAGMAVFGDVSIQQTIDLLDEIYGEFSDSYMPQIGNYLPYKFHTYSDLREYLYISDSSSTDVGGSTNLYVLDYPWYASEHIIPFRRTATSDTELTRSESYLESLFGADCMALETVEFSDDLQSFIFAPYEFWDVASNGSFVPDGYVWKGEFNRNTKYSANDLITFESNGYEAVYLALQDIPKSLSSGQSIAPSDANVTLVGGRYMKTALGEFWYSRKSEYV